MRRNALLDVIDAKLALNSIQGGFALHGLYMNFTVQAVTSATEINTNKPGRLILLTL